MGETRAIKNRRRARRLAGLLCCAVLVHLAMTAVHVVRRAPAQARAVSAAYLGPVFEQSWSVFAPDPAMVNRHLQVRSRSDNGQWAPWFDLTECDVRQAVRGRPTESRRRVTTFELMRHLKAGQDQLPVAARPVGARAFTHQHWSAELERALTASGSNRSLARRVVKDERAVVGLASMVAAVRRPGADAVQVRVMGRDIGAHDGRPGTPRVEWSTGDRPVVPTSEAQRSAAAAYAPAGGCR